MEVIWIILIIAYLLTKVLKWDFTSSFVVFCITMIILCDEAKLIFLMFAIIVQIQVQYLKRNFRHHIVS